MSVFLPRVRCQQVGQQPDLAGTVTITALQYQDLCLKAGEEAIPKSSQLDHDLPQHCLSGGSAGIQEKKEKLVPAGRV